MNRETILYDAAFHRQQILRQNCHVLMRIYPAAGSCASSYISLFSEYIRSMRTGIRLLSLAIVVIALAACSSTKAPKWDKVSAPSVSSSDPSVEAGRQLFDQHCQQCHRLPDPRTTPMMKFDRAMPAMVAKSKLTWPEGATIMSYIVAAQKGTGGGIEVSPKH